MRTVLAMALAFLVPGGAAHAQPATSVVYLTDLTEISATIGWGVLQKDASITGAPMRLGGVTYAKGLGTHAQSDIRYDLAARCSRFQATVGVDDDVSLGSVRFRVYADGALLFDSHTVLGRSMTGADPGLPLSVDVSSRRELRLLVTDGGNGIGKDHADWADARVACDGGALRPVRQTSYLSDLPATSATIGWGTLGKDVSVSGTPLTLNGIAFAKGIGTHAKSDIRYDLAGTCSRFDAVVGVDDAKTAGSVRFQVYGDDLFLYDSFTAVAGNMTGADPGEPVSLDVSGVRTLRLLVTDGGDKNYSDHADWANARVTCAPAPSDPGGPSGPVYLSDLTATYATVGWGSIHQDRSVEGNPLRVGGVTYGKGIGTHAASDIRYALGGRCSRFSAVVGLDDEVTKGSVRFRVFADGALLYDSAADLGRNVTAADAGRPVSVDVSARQELRLLVSDGGDNIYSDHADWADAVATCAGGGSPTVAAFAYWNVYGGNGMNHLDLPNYTNPDQPFGCWSMSGEPADDSLYRTGVGAAIRQADGAMRETLIHEIANDPAVVALGLGEGWGGGDPQNVLPVLGWSAANATVRNSGDSILTRYGFTEQGLSPPIGEAGGEVYRAVYANVCLDAACARTMPFFAVHTQALQGEYAPFMTTLLDYVASLVPEGEPRIVMGDFNAWDNQTDRHICIPSNEPGPSHEEGIRLIISSGYTDLLRLKSPEGNRYTGMLNSTGYSRYPNYCLMAAGLTQGHPYKAIDHAYAKGIAPADVLSAQRFGVPVGGYGNCAASDHLGLKVSVRLPP